MGILYVSPDPEPAEVEIAIPALASPPQDAPELEPVVSPRKRGARAVARVDVPADPPEGDA